MTPWRPAQSLIDPDQEPISAFSRDLFCLSSTGNTVVVFMTSPTLHLLWLILESRRSEPGCVRRFPTWGSRW